MKKRILAVIAALSVTLSSLTGCSLSMSTDISDEQTRELEQLRAMGVISDEESQLGIPLSSNKITSKLSAGGYYVKHKDVLYPCYTDTQTYEKIDNYAPEPKIRFNIYTSESIINIPTLFEGDELYYYSPQGILMYSTFERFKDLGWSIGFRNIKTTPAGYCYLDMETEQDEGICVVSTADGVRTMFPDGKIFIDKIGDVKVTEDFLQDGIVKELTEGTKYDLELYDGTNYKYFSATCNTRYFQSYEIYLLDKYEALQDYMYKIEIPEWLPSGYYSVDARGMFRYIKGSEYDDTTDFNERLLYQYVSHDEGDMSHDTDKLPLAYSENPKLNQFKAYDEGYFAWDQTRNKTKEELEAEEAALKETAEYMNPTGLANFTAASITTTDIWLPKGLPVKITIESKESTGYISLIFSNGRSVNIPYDRVSGAYTYEGTGKGDIVTLETKGLYTDYKITMTNAETYHGQDMEENAVEGENTADNKTKQ